MKTSFGFAYDVNGDTYLGPPPDIGTSDIVEVYTLADLPAPVGSVITIPVGTVIRPHGIIDLGLNQLALNPGTVVLGSRVGLDGFTSANVGGTVVRTGAGGSRDIVWCTLRNTGALGAAVNIVCIAGDILLTRFSNFDGGGNGAGIQLTGTCDNFNAYRPRFNNCTTCIDLDASFQDVAIINPIAQSGDNPVGYTGIRSRATSQYNTFMTALGVFGSTDPSDTMLDIDEPVSIDRGIVVTTRTTGPGTDLETGAGKVSPATVNWKFSGNQGILDSTVCGLGRTNIVAPPGAVVTINAVDEWARVNPVGLTWTLTPGASRIEQDGVDPDLFRYIGQDPAGLDISGMISAEKQSGGNQQFGITIQVNGVPAVGSVAASDDESVGELNAGQARQVRTSGHFTLQTGDTFRILIRNRGNAENAEVQQARINVTEL